MVIGIWFLEPLGSVKSGRGGEKGRKREGKGEKRPGLHEDFTHWVHEDTLTYGIAKVKHQNKRVDARHMRR